MNLKSITLASVIFTAACGAPAMVADVPTVRDTGVSSDAPSGMDVPNAIIDVPDAAIDVPGVMVDVPNVMMIDVPNVPDVPNAIGDTGVCPAPTTACAMSGCVDLQTDNDNCGFCGVSCGGGRNCMAGTCVCNMGTMACGNSCVNLQSDSSNCGACGRNCPVNQMCVAGACSLNCAAPNRVCIAGAMMSCVNPQLDVNNCGACGAVCPIRANTGSASCANGVCGVAACNAGFANCNAIAADGCEVNTQSDLTNCGGCGVRCGLAQSCVAGVCRVAGGCVGNPQWTPVTCVTGEWVWSMDRARATTLAAANIARVLTSSNTGPAPGGAQGMCSLDGTGYVSTRSFIMANCDAAWYHIGGRYTGNCGGHNGELYRLLALGANDCYAY